MLKVGVDSFGWYDPENILASFEYIKECGFDSVDYGFGKQLGDGWKVAKEGIVETVFDKSTEEVLEFYRPLKEASEKTGVNICQTHAPFPTWFNGLDEINDYFAMALDKCFAVCEYLGCPAIVIHPISRSTFEKETDSTLTMYRRYIPLIKKYKGVKICIENIFDRLPSKRVIEGRLSNARDLAEIIDLLNEEAGGEYFGCCFDVGHAMLTHRDVNEFVKTLGDRLTVLHIHDNNGLDDQHVMPYSCLDGTGHTVGDWDGFVDGLREIGYKGTICFETFRILKIFPKDVHTEALKLVSAIGHSWARRIEAPVEE